MSSNAHRLQRSSADEPAPYCYADAGQPGSDPSSRPRSEPAEEDRMRERESEACERGRQAAEQQMRGAVNEAVVRSREQTLHAVREFAGERTAYYRRIEGEVVQLALAIARKILHREAQIDPHMLAGIVRVTLEGLDAGTKVDLHVHPQEAGDWRHYFASRMEGAPAPEVHEDAQLAAGECRMETSLGTTEAGIEAQLKEIETGLLDLLAERPTSSGGMRSNCASRDRPGADTANR